MQLDLFGIPQAPVAVPVTKPKRTKEVAVHASSWSFSRLDTMKQCPRKYYYQYFGSKKGKAKNDPYKERLLFLASLKNKYLLMGEIIHHIIKTFFHKAKEGDIWTSDRLINWGIKRFQDSTAYSQQYLLNPVDLPKSEFPPALLKEIVLDAELAEILNTEAISKISTCLAHFSESPTFALLREGGQKQESLLEKKAQFAFGRDVKVSGVIDITFPLDQKVVIADWKTGKADSQETSLQLLAYAWWAIQTQGITADRLTIKKAYLLIDELEELEFSALHLERAKARIIQDIELLTHYDPFGVEGAYQVFSKITHEKVCGLCPFQSVCITSD